MPRRSPRCERAVDVWSRVRFPLAGREVLGTVIEDRGLLGVGGTKLLRVQLDWSNVLEPVETEIRAAELERVALPEDNKLALDKVLRSSRGQRREILEAALKHFGARRRRVAGLGPDNLPVRGQPPRESEVIAALDELAALGFVVKRPDDPYPCYLSTSWLTEYLAETAKPKAHAVAIA